MSVQRDTIAHVCNVVSRQIRDTHKELSLNFIPHHTGQREEAIALEEHDLVVHPAGQYARNVLKRPVESDETIFLGLAVASEKIYFGLSTCSNILGLVTVNMDHYDNAKEAQAHMYHMAWHAIDLVKIRTKPEYKNRFNNGPMIPKRSPLNLAKANLRADVFSALMSAFQGDKEAIHNLAADRAWNALSSIPGYRAEHYPYIIAMEAAQFAFNEVTKTTVSKNRMVTLAEQIAEDVGSTFDDSAIRQWWAFSDPAQSMAWRNFSKEHILGAAINTSENPYVRANGLLVSEVTNIDPKPSGELLGSYNAFADPELNARLHRETIDEVFEDVIAQGVFENSGAAFLKAANHQNTMLTEGKIIGWCASSLQAAARAFENALANGMSPSQAARLEFEGERNKTTWDSIRGLGEKIIEQRRFGYAVTFSDILEMCKSSPQFTPVLDSIKVTMNDPGFVSKLQAANDMAYVRANGPSPRRSVPEPAAQPKAQAPQGPAGSALAALAPSLGGSKSHLIRQRILQAQQQGKESAEDEN